MIEQQILDCLKKRTDNAPFLYSLEEKRWWTYQQVWQGALAYKRCFEQMGKKEIAVILENGVPLFLSYFACMLSDFVLIPLDPQKSQEELAQVLAHHPQAGVVDDLRQLPGTDGEPVEQAGLVALVEKIDLERLYMITYTSGSTGQAKGVMHCLKSLFHAGLVFGRAVGFGAQCVACHTMPMTYMAGILNTILMPLIMGSRIVLFPRFDVFTAVSFWKNVMQHEVNAFWLSPTMLNMLMTVDRRGQAREYFQSRRSLFCIGTAPLFPQLKERFETKYGVRLLPSYGLSETLFLSSEYDGAEETRGSVGNILPEVQLRFDGGGEILAGVPWMFLGYSNEDAGAYFTQGLYRTGDLGHVEAEKLFIDGRKKELIIKGGMNISPKRLEEVLLESGLVKECCVSSVVIDEEERIVCWAVLNGGEEDAGSALNRVVTGRLGRACAVDRYVFAERIPKNLNGKADKETMKKRLLASLRGENEG